MLLEFKLAFNPSLNTWMLLSYLGHTCICQKKRIYVVKKELYVKRMSQLIYNSSVQLKKNIYTLK